MNKNFYICITFDTDSDECDPSIKDAPVSTPSFECVKNLVCDIYPLLTDMCSNESLALRSTWMVRVDREVEYWFGSYSYLISEFKIFFNRILQAGGEIGYHPHIYDVDAVGLTRATNDQELIETEFLKGYEALHATKLERKISSVRMGEAIFSNQIASLIEDIGFSVDSSAMPGRHRNDVDRVLDWRGAPFSPYRPSISDYRKPGLPARSYLEVPMSMVQSRATYDKKPLLRYVDLSFHSKAISDGLKEWIENHNYLVTMTHPSGIFPRKKSHGLIGFTLENFLFNFRFCLDIVRMSGYQPVFVTLSEIKQLRHEIY